MNFTYVIKQAVDNYNNTKDETNYYLQHLADSLQKSISNLVDGVTITADKNRISLHYRGIDYKIFHFDATMNILVARTLSRYTGRRMVMLEPCRHINLSDDFDDNDTKVKELILKSKGVSSLMNKIINKKQLTND